MSSDCSLKLFPLIFNCCGNVWSSQKQKFRSAVTQKTLKSLMAHRVIIHHAQTNTHTHTHMKSPQWHFNTGVGKTQYKWQLHAMLWCRCAWLIAFIYFSSCISQTTQTLHHSWSLFSWSSKKQHTASWLFFVYFQKIKTCRPTSKSLFCT